MKKSIFCFSFSDVILPVAVAVITLTTTPFFTATAQIQQGQTSTVTSSITQPEIRQGAENIPPILEQAISPCAEGLTFQCGELIYASPQLVVLKGDVLPAAQIGDVVDNKFLWRAVHEIIALGYRIESVSMGGVGSEGNPNYLYVVMVKP